MYVALVILHSWLRWLVLLAGANALARAMGGASSGRRWGTGDEQAGRWLVILFDLQFLIGLILYAGLSPLTRLAFSDFGAAIRMRGMIRARLCAPQELLPVELNA